MESIKEPFVAVPHWVQEYPMSSDMNVTQYKIYCTVVRYSYGYGEKYCFLALTRLSELTGCNRRQITRELKAMLEKGILRSRMKDGNREIGINPELKKRNVSVTLQEGGDSTDTSTGDSGDTRTGDSTDTHIKKGFKESIKKDNNNTSNYHSTAWFLNEYEHGMKEEIEEYLDFYYRCYKHLKEEDHPKLKEEQLLNVYETFKAMLNEYGEAMEGAIRDFYTTVKLSDHNVNHFIHPEIITRLCERNK